jgi:hypothetical protein
MIRIVVQADVADQIRRSQGQVELVDDLGNRVGVVRRPPSMVAGARFRSCMSSAMRSMYGFSLLWYGVMETSLASAVK